MLQPSRYGGAGVDADEFISAVEGLSALDGSAGWLTAAFNTAAYDMAGLPAADDVWSDDPDALVVASYRPEGRLVRSGRDRRLTGRWRSVAGCEYAGWLLLTAHDEDGPSAILLPRSDIDIHPVRPRPGLLAAGICDVTVSEAAVAEHRVFQCASARVEFEAASRIPTPVVVGAAAAAAVVGSADGVWRSHVDQVRERLAVSYGSEEVTDQASSTTQVARTASDIDAAKLQIAASIQRSDTGDVDVRAAAWAHRQAIVRARDATDHLLASNHRHALDASDPVTRLWQDVHAGCRLTIRLLDGLDPG